MAATTSQDYSIPNLVFAKLTTDLDKLDIENKDDVNIYVIDPFEVTYDLFIKAFYNNGSTLSYYQPPTAPSNPLENAKLKNILFLNSGGGVFTDTSTSTPTTVTLDKKTITFNDQINPPQEAYVYNTFIIQDINLISGIESIDDWSFDSQIELSKKLAVYQYLYQFDVILTAKSDGTPANTNALDLTQLHQSANTFIYKYWNDKGQTPPLDDEGKAEIILNFAASFKVKLDDGDTTTPIKTTDTRLLFQYKIKDWPYQSVAF